MSAFKGFEQLHKGVQRWLWEQQWTALRDIQEQAIAPILAADCDVIISASTAAGKTEAAFLPACSRVAEQSLNGIGLLYVSPLKALINDQHRRLQRLGEMLDLPITPWHGDASNSEKDKQHHHPRGIVLITPESLESLLLNHGTWCHQSFAGLSHIIIDEFHAFIGTERGCQLQSLMHRLEFLIQRIIPRIALSATLGELQLIAQYLRPHGNFPHTLIASTAARTALKIQLRGYLSSLREDSPATNGKIADDIYRLLRRKSNLVFANSRAQTENIAAALADHCDYEGVPNEFFPHHGSLSKEVRKDLEVRLQQGTLPTTAVCTMTLELGIDIGSVDSVAQVTAPYSVASLRQRLGRSGRRGEAAILRLFIPENEITAQSHPNDQLRLQIFQCIAIVNLLLKKHYEPAFSNHYHFSTLVQQTLSVIAQYGGVHANQLWALLCSDAGPFSTVDQKLFASFLRALGKQSLIIQTHDGQLILGQKGEKLVEHYSFFTAFNTPEEYRLECNGRLLGTIPIDKPFMKGQLIIFGGKRWAVEHINVEKRRINLVQATRGKAPKFSGEGPIIHNIVRQEIWRVYQQKSIPTYLNTTARLLFNEGVAHFHRLELHKKEVLQLGNTVYAFPWLGDRITNTLTVFFRTQGLAANCFSGVIDIADTSLDGFYKAIKKTLKGPKPTAAALANNIPDTTVDKYDWVLPKAIRDLGYGAKCFDIDGAWAWMKKSVVD